MTTSAHRWSQVEQALQELIELAPEHQQQRLQELGETDPALQQRIARLLRASAVDTGNLQDFEFRLQAEPPLAALPAGTPLGAYRVVELIGRGGMGEVYRCERDDGLFTMPAAAKVLRAEALQHLQRFEDERQIVARLSHPGIARLLDGGVVGERPYMLMEYVDGLPVNEYLRSRRPSLDTILDLFQRICAAVAHAHEQGVIHRDLKPGNILITAQAQPKLLDFGIAKLIEDSEADDATTTRAPLTVAYAAPEQLRGQAIGPATDVHALGVILSELLTGVLPWGDVAAAPVSALMHQVLHETPAPLSQQATDSPPVAPALLGGDLEAIVARALNKAPAQRYASAAALAEEIGHVRRGEPVQARSKVHTSTRPDAAERRQMSVMFCDLVGSTRLSEELDPEDFREIVMRYQDTVAAVVERYQGHIAQYLGDGVLVYFGYPQAHEDDAERAVRCGHDILHAIAREPQQPPLQVRIGVHSGPVVVGETGGRSGQTLAMGVTTNIAARLQEMAEPQSVVISAATLKLVPGLFVTRDLGTLPAKGLDEPLACHAVLRPSGVKSRLEAAARLTPFVGRAQELALLQDRWERAIEDEGQAALLTAEPGIGKSRLLLQFRDSLAGQPHSWLECRCTPMLRNSALAPIIELIMEGLGVQPSDDGATRLQQLEQAMIDIDQPLDEAVPLLAPLLDFPLSARYEISPYGPELKRKKLHGLLSAWLMGLAREQPLLLVVEDLHWADPATRDLLWHVIEDLPSRKVMLLLSARPEFQPGWPSRLHLTQITLPPLRQRDSATMLAHLAGESPLSERLQALILEHTGGVPLFVEEVLKNLLESDQLIEQAGSLDLAGRTDTLDIPATLQDSLTARIDRLGTARTLLQIGAAIGREVPYELLRRVAELAEPELQAQLATLVENQLLYRRGQPPQAMYQFKHALIQDAAAQALLKSRRRELQGRIAQVIHTQMPDYAASHLEEVAMHFEAAEDALNAAEYYLRAAAQADQRSEPAMILHFVESALAQQQRAEAGDAADLLRARAQVLAASAHTQAGNYADADDCARLEEGLKLARQLGETELMLQCLALLWMSYFSSGKLAASAAIAAEFQRLARDHAPTWVQTWAEGVGAWTAVSQGRLSDAVREHRRAALLVPDDAAERAAMFDLQRRTFSGHDGDVGLLAIQAREAWLSGHQRRAHSIALDQVERASRHNHPVPPIIAPIQGIAVVGCFSRDSDLVERFLPSCRDRAEELGLYDNQLRAEHFLFLARCQRGALDQWLPELRRTLAASWQRNIWSLDSSVCGMAAEACLDAGRLDDAHQMLEQAFEVQQRCGENFWLSELQRLQGELALRRDDDPDTAAACFEQARQTAESQGALSLVLRAVLSQAHLSSRIGDEAAARDALRAVCERFEAGEDNPDLESARAWLDSSR